MSTLHGFVKGVQRNIRYRPRIEQLEQRLAPATWLVNNTSYSPFVQNSLPWAVAQADQDQTSTAVNIAFSAAMAGAIIPLAGTLDIYNVAGKTIQIDAPEGGVTIAGGGVNSNFPIFQIEPNTTAILNGLTLVSGQASYGSAIANGGALTLQNCIITGNTSVSSGQTENFGAVYNAGSLLVANCTFSNNTASNSAAGSSYFYGYGGAITNAGNMTIANSSFLGNSAFGYYGSGGGAIFNLGALAIAGSTFSGNVSGSNGGAITNYNGNLTIVSSTITNNSSSGGGGVLNYFGAVSITNSTIAANTAAAGGGVYNNSGTVLLRNSIVAGNAANNGQPNLDGNNVAPGSSFNLIGVGTSGGLVHGINGNLVGIVDPGLAPLGNYGGPTPTMPLLPGSPALDAGDTSLIPASTDQRGLPRIVNGTVDIGAFESQGFTIALWSGNNQMAGVNTAFAQPLTVQVVANNPMEPVNGGRVVFFVPDSGATALLSSGEASLVSGKASVSARANAVLGMYAVSAATRGAGMVAFSLANIAQSLGDLSTTQWTYRAPRYSGTIPIHGGSGTYSKLIVTGLPSGLRAAIVGGAVVITGTPTRAGLYSAIKVSLRDGSGATLTGTYSLMINPTPVLGRPTELAWTLNQPGYESTLTITNGTGPYTLTSVTGLPPGVTATLSGNTVILSGAPTQRGAFRAILSLQDSVGAKFRGIYTVSIYPAPILGKLSRTLWTVNRPSFAATIAIAGGTAPFVLTSISGLPEGLTTTLVGRTIKITGTPTQSGTFDFSLMVADKSGFVVSQSYVLTINP